MLLSWIPPTENQNPRFPLFDILRGMAAFLVACFHFWTFFPFGADGNPLFHIFSLPFAGGHLGVDLFFVISGFVITLSFLRSHSLSSFFSKRFLRIFPLAVFFVITVFILKALLSGGISRELAWNGLAHLLFIQSFFQQTYHGLHPVMWTLTVEVLFYLSLPLLFFCGRKKLSHFLWILGGFTIATWIFRAWISVFFEHWSADERIFYSEQYWGRFDQFALGIGIAMLWVFRKQWVSKFSPYFFIFLKWGGIVSFLLLFPLFAEIGSTFRESLFLQVFLHFGISFALSMGIVGILFSHSHSRKNEEEGTPDSLVNNSDFQRVSIPPKEGMVRSAKILASSGMIESVCIWLGNISYSLYLWHFPIQSLWKKGISVLPMDVPLIFSFVGVMIITLCVSHYSWKYIEKKIPIFLGI
ncbi:MAG: acyltransferase [Candidatus Peregrinibacteria bacterium]